MFQTEDTIVAVSSAAGQAGRSIVRLSGPEAIGLAEGIFSAPLEGLGGFRSIDGTVSVRAAYPIQVPARAYLFVAPRSYTRQDVVELHLPGEVVASVACGALIDAGARQAGPGEFTARAFFSGRLDLASAQAVADVIDAQADAQLRSAVGVLDGALGRLCRPAAEALTEALAVTEAAIDFAGDGLEMFGAAEMAAAADKVADDLEAVLAATGRFSAGSDEVRVTIAGRPNAGKSSLLNTLGGVDRAIVSTLAGTTRDVLSAPMELSGGTQVMLLDAAGVHASPGKTPGAGHRLEDFDPIDQAAHLAAREAISSAEAVMFVIDAAGGDRDADERLLAEVAGLNRRANPLILANKIDLLAKPGESVAALRRRFGAGVLPVSAVTGAGLDDLRGILSDRLDAAAAPRPGTLLLHENQRRGIAQAAQAARRAAGLLSPAGQVSDVAELLAVELRAALNALGELTGRVVTEDVLSAIFSRFCIGK